MTDRIRDILEQLEQVREDLLALSDDIWNSIDHNDDQALDEGVAFTTRRSNPQFARDPALLRSAMTLPGGVQAEVNLSANHLRDQIRTLLQHFGIEQSALRIYLRQDRDAAA